MHIKVKPVGSCLEVLYYTLNLTQGRKHTRHKTYSYISIVHVIGCAHMFVCTCIIAVSITTKMFCAQHILKKVKSENCLSVMNEMKNVDHAGWCWSRWCCCFCC